uniref:Target of rapamycin complex 2 subunit MAPKAP1 n=1 Tax=Panagrellus redivivus TaxID=6233 RepID=A0A7E4V7F4_PANRE
MSYFSTSDLRDYSRNGFIVEDTTGICAQTLPRIEPKARPGGLPLGFGEPESDERDESEVESSSPEFSIDLDTLDAVLKAKKSELDGRTSVKDVPTKGKVVFKENRSLLDAIPTTAPELATSSMVSDLLAAPASHFHNEYDGYSVFDMSIHWPSPKLKQVCVVVPFADDKPCYYTLTVPNTCTVADLMGLCCFMYTAERREPAITETQDLLLFLAEEMDADTDFPPIDQNLKMSNCLFTNFALTRKPDIRGYHEREFKVVVHFTCGLTYVIMVNSQDTTLEVVRDEAVRRRDADRPDSVHPDFKNLQYVLELVHRPGETVNLKATISGIPNLEFVCLRENSARGDFVPPATKTLDRSSSLQRIQVTTPTSIKGPMSAGFSQKDFNELNFDVAPPFKTEEYMVERLHRIRPKWAAKLIIHSDAVEITPTHVVRRNIVPQSSPKLTFLEFEVIASCSLSLDHSKGCRQVRITYLSIGNEYYKRAYDIIKLLDAQGPPNGVTTGRTSLCSIREGEDSLFRRKTDASTDTDESFGRRTPFHAPSKSTNADLNMVYAHSKWKTLCVEAGEADSWEIVSKITAILDQRYSHVRQIYAESKAGSRTPYEALLKFEQATSGDAESRIISNGRGSGCHTPISPQTPTSKNKRKFSMNPMPMLSRMLSRQD